ncbi:hypothetical protein B0T17DRAFT_358614 [Bombardia bombarda]|uniref:Uncharacterized protein n=1 Tax=Bombardia bombarda TaxID=252184 RepID=A0AA40BW95_9PEZI|nr:hypothetical protein B0T17DRAFT_358614 [Bombardia bombarda]
MSTAGSTIFLTFDLILPAISKRTRPLKEVLLTALQLIDDIDRHHRWSLVDQIHHSHAQRQHSVAQPPLSTPSYVVASVSKGSKFVCLPCLRRFPIVPPLSHVPQSFTPLTSPVEVLVQASLPSHVAILMTTSSADSPVPPSTNGGMAASVASSRLMGEALFDRVKSYQGGVVVESSPFTMPYPSISLASPISLTLLNIDMRPSALGCWC